MPELARRRRLTPSRAWIDNRMAAVAAGALAVVALAACGSGSAKTASGDWPLPNGDLASTRALVASGIDRGNVAKLHAAWRFRFRATPGESGDFTATPVVADGVVYLQDMSSTVFALNERSGRLLWRHRFFYGASPGPNGVAVAGGRVYGATPTNAFALSAGTGKLLWSRRLVTLGDPVIDVAPQIYDGIVFTSTIGLPPGGKGILYALDANNGKLVWRLSTIKGNWAVPREAGGGGAWYPPSVADSQVYWGTANPYPYGGTKTLPNGGAYDGPALYTDSLLVTDAHTGRLIWFDQVTPHDVRDHDFQLPPILVSAAGKELAVGSGKGGVVIAWDRTNTPPALGDEGGRPRERQRPASRPPRSRLPEGCSAVSRRRWRPPTARCSLRSSICASPAAPRATSRSPRSTSRRPGASSWRSTSARGARSGP